MISYVNTRLYGRRDGGVDSLVADARIRSVSNGHHRENGEVESEGWLRDVLGREGDTSHLGIAVVSMDLEDEIAEQAKMRPRPNDILSEGRGGRVAVRFERERLFHPSERCQ